MSRESALLHVGQVSATVAVAVLPLALLVIWTFLPQRLEFIMAESTATIMALSEL